MLKNKQQLIENMEKALGIKHLNPTKTLSPEDRLCIVTNELLRHLGHVESVLNTMGEKGDPTQTTPDGLLIIPRR